MNTIKAFFKHLGLIWGSILSTIGFIIIGVTIYACKKANSIDADFYSDDHVKIFSGAFKSIGYYYFLAIPLIAAIYIYKIKKSAKKKARR